MYANIEELLMAIRYSIAAHPAERETLRAIGALVRQRGLEAGIAAFTDWQKAKAQHPALNGTAAQDACAVAPVGLPASPPEPPAPPIERRVQLRDYQQRAIEMLYDWMEANKGNPCIELPTGAGKSHVIAALCHDALTQWPETRILMLTHVKELIEQNLDKLLAHWPTAPVGVYSAGVGRKELDQPITYASIQSLWRRAADLGHVDLVVIDEAHLVSHKDTGMYRATLKSLSEINPRLRVIGLTATPYRLGHGLITDPPALFDRIIKPASVTELIVNGFLAPLKPKNTDTTYDVSGVKTRHGEFVESELQERVNTDELNKHVVQEIIARAGNRRHWLVFCAGVDHATDVAREFARQGVKAECVTGETPKRERERIIAAFKTGEVRALTNANVLTTGFDFPDIDLIAMLRPTQSPGLYVQMAGRGFRLKSHTDHCLVLDFAGNTARHGPVDNVIAPDKSTPTGTAPTKTCPQCDEIVAASTRVCPDCGYEFPFEPRQPPSLQLRDDPILSGQAKEAIVRSWHWRVHTSRQSGKELLACDYDCDTIEAYGLWLTDYYPIHHGGYASQRAWRELEEIAARGLRRRAFDYDPNAPIKEIAKKWAQIPPPKRIFFVREGKFFRVIKRVWED